MNFSEAFEQIKTGETAMRLPFWNQNTKISVQIPNELAANTHPYLYVTSDYGRCPWIPTYPELFAEDWEIVA